MYVLLPCESVVAAAVPNCSFPFRENFFKDAGEVVDVRFATDHEGNFKGFGHVEFSTAEAALKVWTSIYIYVCFCIYDHISDLTRQL